MRNALDSRAAVPVAAALLVVSLVATIGKFVLVGTAVPGGYLAANLGLSELAPAVATFLVAAFGMAVIARSGQTGYGWLMVVFGAAQGVTSYAGIHAAAAVERDLPVEQVALWVQDLWMITPLFTLLLLPALFPDAEAPTEGLRRAVARLAIGWLVLIAVFAFADREASNAMLDLDEPPANPLGVIPVPRIAILVTWIGLSFASIAVSARSLRARWRSADREVRAQIKWVLASFGLLLVVGAVFLGNGVLVDGFGVDAGLTVPIDILSSLATLTLPVGLGVAVLGFRLYDVDLVINRTAVYGVLTAVLVAGYVALVAGIGAIVPVDRSSVALIATGAVAVAFAPMRERVQGAVNRLMFGHRDDPYAVLSELGEQMIRAGTPDETLATLAETIARSLRLPAVTVEVADGDGWRVGARHGEPVDEVSGEVVPLVHRGMTVGRLLVAPRGRGESLTDRDRELLEQVARHAGAITRSVSLLTMLQRSRERLVLAREEERRRMRRDLHDGLGPSLASQTFQLDRVRDQISSDPDAAAEGIRTIKRQTQELVAEIRRIVHELRPPSLDELGVGGALAAHAATLGPSAGLPIEVVTDPDPLPRLPAAVEVAAYRIAREAITNTIRHASASRCTASVAATSSRVIVTISDDGRGIDDDVRPGVGLLSMRERTEELGGTFDVAGGAAGTTVVADLPVVNGTPRD